VSFAVRNNAPDVLRMVLSAGVDAGVADHRGMTPLHVACGCEINTPPIDPVIVDLLLAAGADVNASTDNGETALVFACRRVMRVRTHNMDCFSLNSTLSGLTSCVQDKQNSTAIESIPRRLLLGGACRHKAWDGCNSAFLGSSLGSQNLETFVSLMSCGVDYWSRPLHGEHCAALRSVVHTMMLVRLRLCGSDAMVVLPEEMWMEIVQFLRAADF